MRNQTGTEATLYLDDGDLSEELELRSNVSPLGLSGDIGAFKKLDILLRSTTHESPGLFGVKYQFIGKPRREAKKGNHSFAVAFLYGSSSTTDSSDDIFDGDYDTDFTAESEQYITELQLIYSFRTSNSTIVYGGYKLDEHEFETKITKSDDDPSLVGFSKAFNTTAHTLFLGVKEYMRTFHYGLEIGSQQTNWTNTDQAVFSFVAIELGWKWDGKAD